MFGNQSLKCGEFRVPGFPDFLGTHGMTPQNVSETIISEHLDQLLIEEVPWSLPSPLAADTAAASWPPLMRTIGAAIMREHSPRNAVRWVVRIVDSFVRVLPCPTVPT
jgi:hypothetical protein